MVEYHDGTRGWGRELFLSGFLFAVGLFGGSAVPVRAGAVDIDFLQLPNQPTDKARIELQTWQERYDGTAAADAFDALVSFLEQSETLGTGDGAEKAVAAGERADSEACVRLIADAFYAVPTPALQKAVEQALSDKTSARRRAALLAAGAVPDAPAVRKALVAMAGKTGTPAERGEAVMALLALGEGRDRATLEACRECVKATDPAVREAARVAVHRLSVTLGEAPTPVINPEAPAPAAIQVGLSMGPGYSLPVAKPGDTNAAFLAVQVGAGGADPFQPTILTALAGVLRAGGTVLVVNPEARDWTGGLVQWAADNQVVLPTGVVRTEGAGTVNYRDYRSFCDFPYCLTDEQNDAAKSGWTKWGPAQATPILSLDRSAALVVVQEPVFGGGRIVFTTVNLDRRGIYRENVLRWVYGDALLARPASYLHPRYGMDTEQTTLHRVWAPEWAAGKPRILWISDEAFKRGLIEVRERVGLDWRFVPYDALPASTTAWKSKSSIGPTLMGQRAAALVEECLPSIDAVVMDTGLMNLLWGLTLTGEQKGNLGLDSLPSHLRRRVARRLNEGMGLVMTYGLRLPSHTASNPAANAALSDFVGPILPFATNNVIGESVVSDYAGKGRLVWFGLLLPHLTEFNPITEPGVPDAFKVREVVKAVARIDPAEYRYALLAKAVLWAAGKETSGPSIRGLALKDAGAGVPVSLELTLGGAFRGSAEVSLRNRYDELSPVETVPVEGPITHVSLKSGLPEGPYVLETVLKEPGGKPVNFAAVQARVGAADTITNLVTDRAFYRDGETAHVTVDLARGLDGEVAVAVRDSYRRKVYARDLKLDATQRRLEIDIPVNQPLTRRWEVELQLRQAGKLVVLERVPIGIELPPLPRDFEVESSLTPPVSLFPMLKDRMSVNRISGDSADTGLRYNFDFNAGGWGTPFGGSASPGASSKPNVRNPCLSDPAFRLRAVRDIRANGPLWKGLGINSYMVDDECEVGIACLCEHSMYQFRRWLKERYPDLAALNTEWGASFASWDDVRPLEDPKPERPASRVDQRTFQMWEFAEYCNFLEVLGGDYMPGFTAGQSGGVNDNLMMELSGYNYYYGVIEAVPALMRRKDGMIGSWFRPGYSYREDHEADCRRWPWWHLFRGTTRMGLWYTPPGGSPGFHGDLRPYQAYVWLGEEMRELHGGGLGRLLLNARRDEGRCAVYASERSGFIRDAVKKMKGAETAVVNNSATAFLARRIECRPISEYQVERGDIARRGLKLLCLPSVVSLSERERAALREFVKGGGVLVADFGPGLRNEHGTLRDDAFTRELFGVATGEGTAHPVASNVSFMAESADVPLPALRRLGAFVVSSVGREVKVTDGTALAKVADGSPALVVKKVGAGRCVFLNFPLSTSTTNALALALADDLAALAGVTPAVELAAGTNALPSVDFGVFRDGDAFYVGLVAIGSGGMIAKEAVIDTRVTFPETRHLYDARLGTYLGQVKTVELRFTPGIAKVYAGLPAKVSALQVTSAQSRYRPGETVDLKVAAVADAAVTWRQVLSVRVKRPDGTEEPAYARTLLVEKGQATLRLPLALDAAAGGWAVELRDAATGVKGQCQIGVQP